MPEEARRDLLQMIEEEIEETMLEFVREGGVLPPCVIEAHTNWIKDQFLKAGFAITKVVNDTRVQVAVYMMNNYKKLGV